MISSDNETGLAIDFNDGSLCCNYVDSLYVGENHESREAEDFIIMQFTGLKDRHGVEIYEGDILKVNYIHGPHDKVCVVRWDEKNALFRLEPGRHDDLTTLTWSIHDTVFGHNVIGNIYQNPELLPQEASNREGDA